MGLFDTPTDALPPPVLQGGELAANATGTTSFNVGPWVGFNEGDTVQILGGFGNQILGSAVVPSGKSFVGSSAKVDTVNVPVLVATLRTIGTGSCVVSARWVHKNGEAFGSKSSAESTVRIG